MIRIAHTAIAAIGLVLLVQACRSTKGSTAQSKQAGAPLPDEQMILIAEGRWSDADQHALVHGHAIYTTRCQKCHGDKGLGKRSEEDWLKAINKMAPKANLNDQEKSDLERYVLSARQSLLSK